jgi:hypothetical protein
VPEGHTIHRLGPDPLRPDADAPSGVDAEDRLSVPESESRRVYMQEHCRDCGAPVTLSTVGSRTAYFCPVEQPT